LPADEKATLQDAAVLGRVFWAGAIEYLSGDSRTTVEGRLHVLERKQLIARQRRPTVASETEYVFRHMLMREVAYGRIPRPRRAEKHRLAAEWLESLSRPEDQAEQIAHHYASVLELARAAGLTDSSLEERARLALREAGDRAARLNSYAAAARFYRWALDLWPRADAGWPLLLFDYGEAVFYAEERGMELLEQAREALVAVGDVGRAAEAEVMIGRLTFRHGEGEATIAHYRRALELVEDAPPSRWKAWVLAQVARSLIVAALSEEALATGLEALEMASDLGLEDLRAIALMAVGDARIELGDLDGRFDFERGIALAEELNSPDCVTGHANLADTLMDLGELDAAIGARADAQRTAERFGDARSLRWLRAERAGELYWTGDWDETVRLADEFIAESEAGDRHYQEIYCRVVRGRIRLARGNTVHALDDALRALEFGRSARDPQALYPALALTARASHVAGTRPDAEEAANELLANATASEELPVAYLWLLDLAVALHDFGRSDELLGAIERARKPTPWLAGARAFALGELGAAAGIYERIGAAPDEALVRLRAARALVEARERDAAARELERALAFYRSVDAAAAIETGEQLLRVASA
jgi:tetratricopeptide (TPR) repeat protein